MDINALSKELAVSPNLRQRASPTKYSVPIITSALVKQICVHSRLMMHTALMELTLINPIVQPSIVQTS
jgi:hypothetical protein